MCYNLHMNNFLLNILEVVPPILFTLLLIPGIIASFFPAIPGTIYMFIVAILYDAVTGFQKISGTELVVLAVIVAVAMLIDFVAGSVGASKGGANMKSILAGMVGLIFGSLFIPIPVVGSFAGFYIGVFTGEILQHHSKSKALKAAKYGLAGSLVGTVSNICLSLVFFILFIYFIATN